MDYQNLFHAFNARYFNDKLPQYQIQIVSHISRVGEAGRIYRKRRLIKIASAEEEIMTITLLHEMAHAATNDRHGPLWKQEITRLIESGAPLPKQENLMPCRITKGDIIDAVGEAFTAVPTITFASFVKAFARVQGISAAGLLRNYPWIRKAFREGKREILEMKKFEEEFEKERHHGKHL